MKDPQYNGIPVMRSMQGDITPDSWQPPHAMMTKCTHTFTQSCSHTCTQNCSQLAGWF